MKDFFSKYDQIRSFLRSLYYLLEKFLMGNFNFLYSKALEVIPHFFFFVLGTTVQVL